MVSRGIKTTDKSPGTRGRGHAGKDVGRIVRELCWGLHLSDPTEPCLGAADAAAVCLTGGTRATERAGGSADPGERENQETPHGLRARSPRARAGDSGSRGARRAVGSGQEAAAEETDACLSGPPGASRGRSGSSGPREKRRPHRALKHSKGLVRSAERLRGAYGVVPPPGDCGVPGGASQNRSRTGGNCGVGGNDRLQHQWTIQTKVKAHAIPEGPRDVGLGIPCGGREPDPRSPSAHEHKTPPRREENGPPSSQ
ncbi:hypothetical protein NDU88_000825 [Pleurodeles waltl]|uniref:Uncharacterized protein n=1 Tax=Pleurodeles waltl TaxID=8319 RepID=A0AAV7UR20_PLEWA|nr:hypothetical protein NDU88_000825 [Pleurodeles waltl]